MLKRILNLCSAGMWLFSNNVAAAATTIFPLRGGSFAEAHRRKQALRG